MSINKHKNLVNIFSKLLLSRRIYPHYFVQNGVFGLLSARCTCFWIRFIASKLMAMIEVIKIKRKYEWVITNKSGENNRYLRPKKIIRSAYQWLKNNIFLARKIQFFFNNSPDISELFYF